MEQSSPPGYLMILMDTSVAGNPGPFAEDVERVKQLPDHLVDGLLAYGRDLKRWQGEQPCLWYDRQRKRCKHYEHRPGICREALQPGDESCRAWRNQYQVQPN